MIYTFESWQYTVPMALDDISAGHHENDLSETSLESGLIALVLRKLEEIRTNPSSYMDEGGAAVVHELPGGLCMKIMHDRHSSKDASLMNLGNTVAQESHFLRALENFSVSGVRTPRYIAHIESTLPGEPNIIIMEKLDAVNLQHVLNGTAEVPENFDAKIFFDALDAYIQALSEVHHIAHRDLEPRNVMIDRSTGLPYVIDFGRARSLRGLSVSDRRSLVDGDDLAVEKIYVAWLNASTKK